MVLLAWQGHWAATLFCITGSGKRGYSEHWDHRVLKRLRGRKKRFLDSDQNTWAYHVGISRGHITWAYHLEHTVEREDGVPSPHSVITTQAVMLRTQQRFDQASKLQVQDWTWLHFSPGAPDCRLAGWRTWNGAVSRAGKGRQRFGSMVHGRGSETCGGCNCPLAFHPWLFDNQLVRYLCAKQTAPCL